MITALSSLLALALAVPSSGQTTQTSDYVSPCPNVFTYEPPGTEPGKWYGVVNLTTDTTLYALWLNIVLESKADILGNWVGEVTTDDNIDFKIENTKMKISPGPPLVIRFFIQYNAQNPPPRLRAIRFNGREICNVESPQVVQSEVPVRTVVNYGEPVRDVTTSTTARPTVTTTPRSYDRQTTKSQYWQTEKPQTTTQSPYWTQTTSKSQYWTEGKTTSNYQVTSQVKERTTVKPYWQQAKIENNQQTTTQGSQTTTKNLYWTQAKTEDKTTTVRPQVWSQVKTDNKQLPRTDTKTRTTTENNLPSNNWSYTKGTNQLTKTQDRNNKNQATSKPNTERHSQVAYEITTQSQLWAQYKVESDQQTTSRTRLQTKNENKQQTTEKPPIWPIAKITDNQQANVEVHQTKPENKSHVKVETPEQTQYWPKIPDENISRVSVKEPSRLETDIILHRQSSNSQNKQESTSFIWAESEQKTPNGNFQSKPYEQAQPKPVKSSDQILKESDPIYVRPEDRQPSPDRYETRPKENLQAKLPNIQIDTVSNHHVGPEASYQKRTEERPQNRDEEKLEIRPIKRTGQGSGQKQSWSDESTSSWAGDSSQSWIDGTKNVMEYETGVKSSKYAEDSLVKNLDDDDQLPYHKYQLTTELPQPEFLKPTEEDYDAPKKDDVEYYVGGLPMIYVPYHGPRRPNDYQCGKVLLNKNVPLKPRGRITLEGQWPWQIALYQQQTSVDFKYICGGTLVTRRHIITAAHCVTRKNSIRVVNKNTLTVYLGKHNLRNSVEGVQVKFVSRILVHPEYNATTFRRDLAILELRDAVTFSDRVQPVCLWPENEIDLKNIIGQKGSVVGWGFEVTGVAREELSLLEMPVVDQSTCIRSYPAFFGRYTSEKTFCAGHVDGTGICNGDSGGGMVFEKPDGWYLRGVASLSVARKGEYRCDPDHYVIFTDVAKFLPWIEENIEV